MWRGAVRHVRPVPLAAWLWFAEDGRFRQACRWCEPGRAWRCRARFAPGRHERPVGGSQIASWPVATRRASWRPWLPACRAMWRVAVRHVRPVPIAAWSWSVAGGRSRQACRSREPRRAWQYRGRFASGHRGHPADGQPIASWLVAIRRAWWWPCWPACRATRKAAFHRVRLAPSAAPFPVPPIAIASWRATG